MLSNLDFIDKNICDILVKDVLIANLSIATFVILIIFHTLMRYLLRDNFFHMPHVSTSLDLAYTIIKSAQIQAKNYF